MQLSGKVLAGTTQTITTKKGTALEKTRLKILDMGDEVAGDVQFYWVDFLDSAALTEAELAQVNHAEVVVEVRRVMATAGKDGKAYLNLTGGLVLLGGNPVQAALRNGQGRK